MPEYTRRSLMRTAVAAAGMAAVVGGTAMATSAQAADRPGDGRTRPPTFVFLNGTCASSLWWAGLTPELALRGYRTVAVDLPGHGVEAHFPLAYQAPQDLEALATVPSLRVNWRSSDPQFLAAVKAAVAADYTDDEVRAMLNLLEPDETLSVLAADARGQADLWGRIPRTYIRFTQDLEFPLALQDRMIAEADRRTPGNQFDVRSVDASHAGPMHRPEVVAILDELGRRRPGRSAIDTALIPIR